MTEKRLPKDSRIRVEKLHAGNTMRVVSMDCFATETKLSQVACVHVRYFLIGIK